MKNCTDEMLEVCIYKDTITDYFTKYDMDSDDPFFDTPDNLIELEFPRSLVEEWYTANGISNAFDGLDFDEWLSDESTADDTITLYDYAVEHGFKPDFPKPRKFEVQLSATYEVWAFDRDNAVEMANRQLKSTDLYTYVDGKCWS